MYNRLKGCLLPLAVVLERAFDFLKDRDFSVFFYSVSVGCRQRSRENKLAT